MLRTESAWNRKNSNLGMRKKFFLVYLDDFPAIIREPEFTIKFFSYFFFNYLVDVNHNDVIQNFQKNIIFTPFIIKSNPPGHFLDFEIQTFAFFLPILLTF